MINASIITGSFPHLLSCLAEFGGNAITLFFLVGLLVGMLVGRLVIVGERVGDIEGGGDGETVGWYVIGRLNTSKLI